MTFVEAVNAIENKAMEFKFIDKFDEPLLPAMAVARAANICGPEWDENFNDWESKRITNERYALNAIAMMDKIMALNHNAEIDQLLSEIIDEEKNRKG